MKRIINVNMFLKNCPQAVAASLLKKRIFLSKGLFSWRTREPVEQEIEIVSRMMKRKMI